MVLIKAHNMRICNIVWYTSGIYLPSICNHCIANHIESHTITSHLPICSLTRNNINCGTIQYIFFTLTPPNPISTPNRIPQSHSHFYYIFIRFLPLSVLFCLVACYAAGSRSEAPVPLDFCPSIRYD